MHARRTPFAPARPLSALLWVPLWAFGLGACASEPEEVTTAGSAELVESGAGEMMTDPVASSEAAQEKTPSTVEDWASLDDAAWSERLSPQAYRVLREAGTERAGTGALLNEKRTGTFTCGGCALPLFSSETKYESGTGWPSFWQPLIDENVGRDTDHKLGYPRTEVHCARCDGHLGHVFTDGPEPTGLRYCINSVALGFEPAE